MCSMLSSSKSSMPSKRLMCSGPWFNKECIFGVKFNFAKPQSSCSFPRHC
jgi:hypothetical protein